MTITTGQICGKSTRGQRKHGRIPLQNLPFSPQIHVIIILDSVEIPRELFTAFGVLLSLVPWWFLFTGQMYASPWYFPQFIILHFVIKFLWCPNFGQFMTCFLHWKQVIDFLLYFPAKYAHDGQNQNPDGEGFYKIQRQGQLAGYFFFFFFFCAWPWLKYI